MIFSSLCRGGGTDGGSDENIQEQQDMVVDPPSPEDNADSGNRNDGSRTPTTTASDAPEGYSFSSPVQPRRLSSLPVLMSPILYRGGEPSANYYERDERRTRRGMANYIFTDSRFERSNPIMSSPSPPSQQGNAEASDTERERRRQLISILDAAIRILEAEDDFDPFSNQDHCFEIYGSRQ